MKQHDMKQISTLGLGVSLDVLWSLESFTEICKKGETRFGGQT